jgi:hypothetical protein
MSRAYQYNDQIILNNPILTNNEMNQQQNLAGNFNVNLATNDPSVLCLSGNAYTIKKKGDEIATQGPV